MKKILIVTVLILPLAAIALWWFSPSSEIIIEEKTDTLIEPPPQADTIVELPLAVQSSSPQIEKEPELQPIKLATRTVAFANGAEASFRLAEPFNIAVAAEGLGKVRFMAVSPDGRIFVPDIVNYNLSHQGKVYILGDFNDITRRFETKHTYLSGLRGPNSVAFYTDEDGKDWIYIALTAHLIRYPYNAGDTAPSGRAEIIAEFPNTQTEGETSVVWHITRTLLFHEGRLYIAIGSGCNSCEHPDGEMRGMILSMDPDGKNVEVYASGLRNSVGLAWGESGLYATANGVDHLGLKAPDELMYAIQKGAQYPWPYCYEVSGEMHSETPQRWKMPYSCADAPRSFTAFAPHSAPLGLAYFNDIHPVLDGAFLVALHGSFEPEIRNGYEIVRVSGEGEQEIFMDGFQKSDGKVVARAVDILQHDKNSFFFTDDYGGRIFYVFEE